MKKVGAVSLILVVLLWALSFPNLAVVQGETEDVHYFLKSTVRYSNPTQSRVWDFTEWEEDQTISLFMNNTWQTVELVNSTFPFETGEDEDGNSVAVLQFPESVLSPGENVSFTVWYHMFSKPRLIPDISENESGNLTEIPNDLRIRYTKGEGSWQTSDSELQGLAQNLAGNETRVLSIVKNFVAWIHVNIDYPDPEEKEKHEVPLYPFQTLNQQKGDCDDQAMLLITLCRIVGIPSYLQTGCIYLPEQGLVNETMWSDLVTLVQRRIGWHGWTVVYVPPWGWLPVDLTYVPEGLSDPLNAIKHGAVTSQDTIQYMNVTHSDYVASSLQTRAFLIENGFNLYMEDEMILAGQKPLAVAVEPWVPLVFMALMALLVTTYILVFRRWIRGSV